MTRFTPFFRARVCAALLACAALLGCGGVGEEGTGIQPASASVGVLQGISDQRVTVNGVSYERSQASVTDAFGQPLAPDSLRLGMWLEVLGRVDEAGDKGVAESIRVRPAARGVVSGTAPGSVTLFDSTVRLGNGTVFDGPVSVSNLVAGDVVEVHGPLSNAAGDVSASRIEKLDAAPVVPPVFELRGRVSQIDTMQQTLLVGRRSVSYANATVTLRAGLTQGLMVRVSAAAAPVAGTPWAVDRLTNELALPDNLGFLYTEGFVDELQAGPLFQLEDLAVDASQANGKFDVTANGQRVAVVGALSKGVLKAKSVVVVQPGEPVIFTLAGAVTEFVSPASFKLRGVPVDASGANFVAPASAAGLANDLRLRVKGTVLGRRLIASQVELLP
jgi:Domain of unknown function (DUF5666)